MGTSILAPYPVFHDSDGTPLESGYIYIGTASLDAETNPITAYWDSALSVTAGQPVRTIGGYASRGGSPGRLYVDADDCSMIVKDKNENLVFSTLSAVDFFQTVTVTSLSPNIQEFTATGVWTKPTVAAMVMIELWGAGGSGGSGRCDAASADTAGGGGGGGGGYVQRICLASDLGATEPVEVGARSAGGTGVVTANDGNAGGAGDPSYFGTSDYYKANGGTGGAGGAGAIVAGGVGGGGGVSTDILAMGEAGAIYNSTNAQGGRGERGGGSGGGGMFAAGSSGAGGCSIVGGPGGGGGGGVTAADQDRAGGDGGTVVDGIWSGYGGAGGTLGGGAGSNGAAVTPRPNESAAGGGGGNDGGSGGNGADGGIAAGGGGGGGCRAGTSGSGGLGGLGYARITTW